MSSSIDNIANNETVKEFDSKLSRKFEAVVRRSARSITVERAMPAVAVSLGIAGTFLAASWFNLWAQLPASGRVAGVALFTTALIGTLASLRNIKTPSRLEAINRIDSVSKIPHRPASVLDDEVSNIIDNGVVGEKMWSLHKLKTQAEINKLRAGIPRAQLKKHDPLMLRYAIPLLVGISAMTVVGHDPLGKLNAAFNWSTPIVASAPPGIEAWITPPHYTGLDKHYLSKGATSVNAIKDIQTRTPEGSILTIRFFGDQADLLASGDINRVTEQTDRFSYPQNSLAPHSEYQFKLNGLSEIIISTKSGHKLNWAFNTKADNPPIVEVTGANNDIARDPNSINITYRLTDEYKGSHLLEGRISPSNEGSDVDNSAKPLLGPPKIKLPLN